MHLRVTNENWTQLMRGCWMQINTFIWLLESNMQPVLSCISDLSGPKWYQCSPRVFWRPSCGTEPAGWGEPNTRRPAHVASPLLPRQTPHCHPHLHLSHYPRHGSDLGEWLCWLHTWGQDFSNACWIWQISYAIFSHTLCSTCDTYRRGRPFQFEWCCDHFTHWIRSSLRTITNHVFTRTVVPDRWRCILIHSSSSGERLQGESMDTCTHAGREDGKNSVCVLCRASGGLVGGPEMFGEVR